MVFLRAFAVWLILIGRRKHSWNFSKVCPGALGRRFFDFVTYAKPTSSLGSAKHKAPPEPGEPITPLFEGYKMLRGDRPSPDI
jgi:hypothetical protein